MTRRYDLQLHVGDSEASRSDAYETGGFWNYVGTRLIGFEFAHELFERNWSTDNGLVAAHEALAARGGTLGLAELYRQFATRHLGDELGFATAARGETPSKRHVETIRPRPGAPATQSVRRQPPVSTKAFKVVFPKPRTLMTLRIEIPEEERDPDLLLIVDGFPATDGVLETTTASACVPDEDTCTVAVRVVNVDDHASASTLMSYSVRATLKEACTFPLPDDVTGLVYHVGGQMGPKQEAMTTGELALSFAAPPGEPARPEGIVHATFTRAGLRSAEGDRTASATVTDSLRLVLECTPTSFSIVGMARIDGIANETAAPDIAATGIAEQTSSIFGTIQGIRTPSLPAAPQAGDQLDDVVNTVELGAGGGVGLQARTRLRGLEVVGRFWYTTAQSRDRISAWKVTGTAESTTRMRGAIITGVIDEQGGAEAIDTELPRGAARVLGGLLGGARTVRQAIEHTVDRSPRQTTRSYYESLFSPSYGVVSTIMKETAESDKVTSFMRLVRVVRK